MHARALTLRARAWNTCRTRSMTRRLRCSMRGCAISRPTTRRNVLTWLYGLPADGGTPLRGALMAVGQYYKRVNGGGPWTDDPSEEQCGRVQQVLPPRLQPAGHGRHWNEDDLLNVANQDGSSGSDLPPNFPDRYVASAPYSDTQVNTLADVAMLFWKNDLQPNMANNVRPFRGAERQTPLTPDSVSIPPDPATWQHMSTFSRAWTCAARWTHPPISTP